jgi:hypothetical protein
MHMHGGPFAHAGEPLWALMATFGTDHGGLFWGKHCYWAPIDANLVCLMKTITPRGVE